MDLLKNINEALHYIEENLEQEIDFKEVVKLACCSEYHFRRMFSFLSGVSLSEYIRRRRLTLAAFELNNSEVRIEKGSLIIILEWQLLRNVQTI